MVRLAVLSAARASVRRAPSIAALTEVELLRAEKVQVIDGLHEIFGSSAAVIVSHYKGLSVPQITELRRQARAAGAGFKVTKNRLVKRALPGTPYESLNDLFLGPTAITYSDDAVSAAKVVVDYAKKNDHLVVVGGGFGGHLLTEEQVRALSNLPSLDELRGRIVGLLNAPAARLIGVLQAPAGQLARILQAHADKAA